MKMFVDPSEVFLYRDFVDFRKAINGLVALVEDELIRINFSDARPKDRFVAKVTVSSNSQWGRLRLRV